MSGAERPLGPGRNPIGLILVSGDEAYAADLKQFLQSHAFDIRLAAVMPEARQLAGALRADPGAVVLLDGDLPADLNEAVKTAQGAGASRIVLLLSSLVTRKQPPAGVELLFKYTLGLTLAERIRSITPPGRAAGAALPAPPSTAEGPAVLAFYSPRGGAGSSTLAANLAYLYAARGLRVVLVDLAHHGSQHIILRQPQRGQGLSSLIALLSQDSSAASDGRVTAHLQRALHRIELGRVQFHLLPAAPPDRMEQVSDRQVQQVVDLLMGSGFHMVILDLSSELTDRVVAGLAAADRVIVPVLPEIVSAWHALQIRDLLGSVVPVRPRLAFLLNRQRSDSGFAPHEFSRLSGVPLLGTIRDEYRRVSRDLAAGRLTAMHSAAPFTRALRRVADQLYQGTQAREVRGRLPWSQP